MPLFQPKLIKKHLHANEALPEDHRAILNTWSKNLDLGIYDSEIQNDSEFIQKILIEVLGYVGSSAGGKWTVAKNQPVGSGNVDVALGHFDPGSAEIYAPFELKGAKTTNLDAVMPSRHKSPVDQAWEYAMDAVGAKWVLVSNYREIRLYAIGYGRKNYESFDLRTLTDPEEYSRFVLLLSAENFLSGRTKALLEESDRQDREITRQLYSDYSELRATLVNEILNKNSRVGPLKAIHFGQKVLDRILFIAFAEDTGLLPDNTLQRAFETRNPFSPQPVWENFQGLFTAIDRGEPSLSIPGYNGGLFAHDDELDDDLQLSDEICEQFKRLGDYDFSSEVSVAILGHVFEQSITDIEELRAQLDPSAEKPDKSITKRKREGIYYTPSSVTWLMAESTIGNWLSRKKREIGFNELPELTLKDYASIRVISKGKRKNQVVFNKNISKHIDAWESYRDILSSIRVLDPACGSGAFLIEAFDFLHREGQLVNNELAKLRGGQTELIRWDKQLLSNNLFGVDLNEESVEITKLSLWLKTADPKEQLTYLDDNILRGNSLVEDEDVAGEDAFNWQRAFPQIMRNGGFDIVLGNPPYIDSEEMVRSGLADTRDYIVNSYNFAKGNWDIYIAFFERGFSLLGAHGELCFISPDKWLSKDFGSGLRAGLFDHFEYICEVGRDVFEDANVDAIVTKITKDPQDTLEISRLNGDSVEKISVSAKKTLSKGKPFDQLFSSSLQLLNKVDEHETRLGDIAPCENACATSDAYELKKILTDAELPRLVRTNHFRVANTGTLDRYVFKWSITPMTYLKDKYLCPVVDKDDFEQNLGNTYIRRAKSPKIIIKGLTLLEGALDSNGDYIPGKSTLVIAHSDLKLLKFLIGIVNSKIASLYVKEMNRSASYNQGVNFNPEMVNQIPIPDKIDRGSIAALTDRAIQASSDLSEKRSNFFTILKEDLGIDKISKKMHQWPDLSFTDFMKEIQKKKVKLSVGKKAEWQEFFRDRTDEAYVIFRELHDADNQINTTLYEAFNLTESEIQIVEDY